VLTPETLYGRAVIGEIIGQKLERDKSSKERVFGLVDHAHATAADLH
jgi:hypothetical protein